MLNKKQDDLEACVDEIIELSRRLGVLSKEIKKEFKDRTLSEEKAKLLKEYNTTFAKLKIYESLFKTCLQ